MNLNTFEALLEVAHQLGLEVRHVHLGGAGGGLACFKGKRQLFVDMDAEPEEQLDRTVDAMASMPEINDVFMRPDVRALFEKRPSAPTNAG
jgi:hypothetical protein